MKPMKADKLNIRMIVSKGEKTLSKKFWLNFLSAALGFLLVFFNMSISDSYLSLIISSLAIFTGFFFTLIVYITDKSVSKIQIIEESEKDATNLSKSQFKKDYVSFTKKIVSQISYSIVMSIALIVLSFLTQLELFSFEVYNIEIDLTCKLQVITSFLFYYIAFRLVYFVLIIISNMQSFFYGEIDQAHKKYD